MNKKVILGDEFDNDLRIKLIILLKEMNGKVINSEWNLIGSQELEIYNVKIGENIIEVESETFVGLSIHGPQKIVEHISSIIHKA